MTMVPFPSVVHHTHVGIVATAATVVIVLVVAVADSIAWGSFVEALYLIQSVFYSALSTLYSS